MRLRLSPRARDDLREIGSYIRTHDPVAAQRVRRALQEHLQMLVQYPRSGRAVGRRVFRSAVPRLPYLVFYRIDDAVGDVLIVTIRHAARRPFPSDAP